MRSRTIITTAAAAAGTSSAFHGLRRWGATPTERAATMPGDELSADARVVHTRAVTIDAPPERVWPWLMQIGQDRSGFFSYTWVENLFGCQMPTVHELREEWSERHPTDKILMTTPSHYGGRAYNVVALVDAPHSFVLVAPGDLARVETGESAKWVWQFDVRPHGDQTRLIVRSRYRCAQWPLEPVHFVMERKMMLTIKKLSERTANTSRPVAAHCRVGLTGE